MTMNGYQSILDALSALTDKRLAYGTLWDDRLGCGCAMGAFLPKELVEQAGRDGMGRSAAYAYSVDRGDELYEFATPLFGAFCEPLGVSAKVVREVQRMNDLASRETTPERRYELVLARLRKKIEETE